MKIFVVESDDPKVNPYSTSIITPLRELGIKKSQITKGEGLDNLDSSFDLLILVTLTIGHVEGKALIGTASMKKIKDFVSSGGICWITQQQINDTNFAWLPSHLNTLRFDYHHIPLIYRTPAFRKGKKEERPYLCPWILDRSHPLWNKPNYMDESDFLYWEPEIGGQKSYTAATHVIIQKGWKILAGFAGAKIDLKDRDALIMEAKYNRGLYFWSEIFPPQAFWQDKNSFGKKAWELFLGNILTYFRDFQKNKVFKVSLRVKPWSVKAGEKVKIKVKTDAQTKRIKRITLQIKEPSGKKEERDISPSKILNKPYFYVPAIGGTYQLKVRVERDDKAFSYGSTCIKTVKGFTPFRFTIHTHFGCEWQPASLGTLYGIARKLGVDIIVLAGVSPWKDFVQNIRPEEIKNVDSPEVRFFEGQEIHTQQHYGIEDGLLSPEKCYGRRHVCIIGCSGIEHDPWQWQPSILKEIHRKGGIALAAHPEPYNWWTVPQAGGNFEGIEINLNVLSMWDEQIKKGEFVGLQGTDNAGVNEIYFKNGYNIGWFDKPISLSSLIDTILKGRVTRMGSYPDPFSSLDNFLWFDINNQPVGGTLYATDKVTLHVRAKSHLPLKEMRIVKYGDRSYKKIKLNSKSLNYSLEEKVHEDTYYRVEIYGDKKDPFWYSYLNFTNPIFVKKTAGPEGSYFYLQNDADPIFRRKKGKWQSNLTEIKKVRFSRGIWEIELDEPGNRGELYFGGVAVDKVEMDGRKVTVWKNCSTGKKIRFGKGQHRIRLFTK